VWDAATGTPIGEPLTGHRSWVTSVAAGQVDGRTVIISGSEDETVRIWHSTFRRRRLRELATYWNRPVTTVAISGDNVDHSVVFALGCDNGIFSLWHSEPGVLIKLSWSLPYRIRMISCLPDNSWVVAFGDEIGIFREAT
jgi:WD40 repeat protein